MIDMEDGQETAEKFRELCELCKSPAQEIKKKTNLLVVSHVDADGLTAAAIVCTALERCDLDFKSLFFRQLDGPALDKVADHCADLVIFTDLGSGMIQQICDRSISAVVADHHKPAACEARSIAHINPHLVGADGATHLSGSGTSSFWQGRWHPSPGNNDDLAALAVVGAVGDLQDMACGHLVGINRHILDIGSRAGTVSFSRDIKFFGRQTRPVCKMLEYSQDPYLPGLSGNEDACIAFLKEIGIRLGGERWRRWIDLSQEEKTRFVTAVLQRGLRSGISNVKLERMIGEVYVLLGEREGTELRDASEYSTLLNATARYGHAGVGLQVCMGDRDKAFCEAQRLLGQHRSNLVNGLKLVRAKGITPLKSIQYFDAGDAILDTIVGIVAGMSFQMADRSRPILAFARTADGELKVSARGTQDLVRSGLDLADALSRCARAVGGVGGGQCRCRGNYLAGGEAGILELVDSTVGRQISN